MINQPLTIVHLSAEARPWASTGGLAEVASALSAAQHDAGHEVWLWLPLYRAARQELDRRGQRLRQTMAGEVILPVGRWSWRAMVLEDGSQNSSSSNRRVGFIDCPDLFDRDGLYHGADHQSFGDNALRFAVFVRAAMEAAPNALGKAANILHCHDWQTALAPYWLRTERPSAWAGCTTAFTIHNLGYPGRFRAETLETLGISRDDFHPDGLEFYGDLALIKAGIIWADVVTTVSPTYAREIRTPAHGEGFDGLLRRHADKLFGVINGISAQWNPALDPHLSSPYDADDLSGKKACRDALLAEMGLKANDRQPVLATISRFAAQKGLDLLADVAPEIVAPGIIAADARLVVLGSGDPALQDRFLALAARYPDHIAVRIGYDVGLSHRIEAGADAFVMPSRYEPCGLNQLYSMAYGTLPIVHRTGGLADTVTHASDDALRMGTATGFVFDHANAQGLRWAVGEAIRCFVERPERWRAMQRTGMTLDLSWQASARRYEGLYRLAAAKRAS